MKNLLTLSFLLLLFVAQSTESEVIKAKINFKPKSEMVPIPIKKEIFGGFMEFVHHWFNSEKGYVAQEIQNRGFDLLHSQPEIPDYWELLTNSNFQKFELIEGGYNENGLYSVRLVNEEKGKYNSIIQKIFLTPDTGNDFYIYIKDNAKSKVEIRLLDTKMNVLHALPIQLSDSDWKKYSGTFPHIEGHGSAYIGFFVLDSSDVEIDEISFMPQNRMFSLRKEYYDLFKLWSPGIMRYPGGWYADSKLAHWQDGIGDIDKRKSPSYNFTHSQRLEFGTDEFIAFCKSLDCEPHICANMREGTPQEAAAWLEYCNGSSESEYGAMRAANGNPEPFNVKFWDIGNEQWDDAEWMANNYVKIWKEMVKVDPNVKYIIGGDLWQGKAFFDKCMEIAAEQMDYYSWHLLSGSFERDIQDSLDVFLTLMGNTIDHERSYITFQQWLTDGGFFPRTRQCITELWTAFNDHDWTFHPRLYKLESGLWTALQMNISIRQSPIFDINERTCNSGMFFTHTDFEAGTRVIAPSPSFWAMALYRNHHGKYNYPLSVECPTYEAKVIPGTWGTPNVPWIDAASSISNDTLFMYIVNRNPNSPVEIECNLNELHANGNMTTYTMTANHFLDGPSAAIPDSVTPIVATKPYDSIFTIPKHTLLIMAIPVDDIIGIESDDTVSNTPISVFPNPFTNAFRIKIASKEINPKNILQFCNSNGEVLYEYKLGNSDEAYFSSADLASGVYFIRLLNEKTELSRKVLKIK